MTNGPGVNSQPFEELEGLDTASADGWGDYPLDSVFVRTETRTVSEVARRIEGDRYILDPEFQRDFVWNSTKQSKLIESCIMRIPLPVFYVAEAPDGRIIVVDGLQRLTTFVRFLNDELKLTGLGNADSHFGSHMLEGKFFRDLPVGLQERVLDTQLTMYILDAKAPERARLDIFERVNSGEPLTRQQMRNALYSGPATTWLREASLLPSFQTATGGSLNKKTMRDREAINRFCAFKLLGSNAYNTSDMDSFLADGLVKLAKLSQDERANLLENFNRVMKMNYSMFGEHAFRKSLADQPPKARSVINISLLEVASIAMSTIIFEDQNHVGQVRDGLRQLLRSDNDFIQAITYSTNSTTAVKTRHFKLTKLVKDASAK